VRRGSKGGHVGKKNQLRRSSHILSRLLNTCWHTSPNIHHPRIELGKIFLIEGKSNPLRNNDLDENMKTAFSRKLTVNI